MKAQHGLARKSVAVVMAVSTAVALAGCGGQGAAVDANGKPKVEILINKRADAVPMKDMQWTKQLEAACDCSITWSEVSGDAWAQQKSPMLASDEVPDISIAAFDPADAEKVPVFEDLSKHLDQLPNVKEFFEQVPEARKLTENPDGNLYVLASSRGKDYSGSGQHMMINKTWLDKLGLEIPTTWDELTKVLEAFKTQDPNGNGEADEIPMNIKKLDTAGFGPSWYSPFLLLNSLGLVTHFNSGPSQQGIYVKDGKVGNFMATDEFKTVVAYLHSLVAEGLIPADAITKDQSKYNAELTSDGKTARTGVAFAYAASDLGDLKDQYVAMPAPAAPGVDPDEVTWDGSVYTTMLANNKLAVRKDAPNMDAILKIVNKLYEPEMAIHQLYGDSPEYVEKTGDKTYKVTDAYNAATKSPTIGGEGLAGWVPDDYEVEDVAFVQSFREADDVYAEQYTHFDQTRDVMPDYVTPDNADSVTISNNNTGIFNYAMPKIGGWITNGGVEEEFDDFVAGLDKLGLNKNVELWQKWYDAYTK